MLQPDLYLQVPRGAFQDVDMLRSQEKSCGKHAACKGDELCLKAGQELGQLGMHP